jgi:hypothetical protein
LAALDSALAASAALRSALAARFASALAAFVAALRCAPFFVPSAPDFGELATITTLLGRSVG